MKRKLFLDETEVLAGIHFLIIDKEQPLTNEANMGKCFECQDSIVSGMLCGICETEKSDSERWVIEQDVFHSEDDTRRLAKMTAGEAINQDETSDNVDDNATADIVYDAHAPRHDDQDWLSSHISDVESGEFDVSAFVKSFSEYQSMDSSERFPLS